MEHQTIQLDKKADAGLSRLVENYIRQLFDDRNVSPENQKQLWEHYYNTLAKGVDLGYSPKPEMYDPALAHSLKYDIAKFSGFKETSFRKQLEAALTKDGKIVPWNEFKKTADEVSDDYNKRWLKTEYNHTIATANMAQQWQDFEADKDLYPNLKYVTAGDARVRDAHKILDGTILPIDHPFWKSHTTPLDWGCRCNIEQSDDEPSKVIPSYKVKPEFQNNAFYSGKVFSENAYEKGFDKTESKVIEAKATKYYENKILQKPRNEQFKELLKQGKGSVKEHLLIKKGSDYNDILTAAKEFSKKGKAAELMPEINQKEKTIRSLIFPNLSSKTSNPDLRVLNKYYDIKRPVAIKNIVGKANDASKQGAIAVISDSRLDKVFTDAIMNDRAKDIFNNKYYAFDEVIFLRQGKIIIYNRKGD